METWARTAKARKSYGIGTTGIDLVVQQALREDHNVTLLQSLGVDSIGGGDEAGGYGALDHQEHLVAAGVGVEWDDATGGKVETCQRNSKAIEARELSCECRGDGGLDDVGGVAGDA